jgi:integrase
MEGQMARRTITDKSIAALKATSKRQTIPDTKVAGLYVRVTPNGIKSFVVVTRAPRLDGEKNGKQIWTTIGRCDEMKIEDARDKARDVRKSIKEPSACPGFKSFKSAADAWYELEAVSHITIKNERAYLDKFILPAFGARDITSIKRSEIAALMDVVQQKARRRRVAAADGRAAANSVLTIIRSITNWYAPRTDDYVSPVIKGMRRGRKVARKRILSDDEIRDVFALPNDTFGSLLKLLLLTGQRRDKVAGMRWEHLRDGVWHMPRADREKGVGGDLVLPEKAIEIINAQPRTSEFVFPGPTGHFKSYSMHRKHLGGGDWRLHDLRRTARSLMSRAKIGEYVAERVLGHAIGGVQGVYDRHKYDEEKAHALKALASLIENIVNPPAGNVVRLVG